MKHFIFNSSTDCSCLTHLKTHFNLTRSSNLHTCAVCKSPS